MMASILRVFLIGGALSGLGLVVAANLLIVFLRIRIDKPDEYIRWAVSSAHVKLGWYNAATLAALSAYFIWRYAERAAGRGGTELATVPSVVLLVVYMMIIVALTLPSIISAFMVASIKNEQDDAGGSNDS